MFAVMDELGAVICASAEKMRWIASSRSGGRKPLLTKIEPRYLENGGSEVDRAEKEAWLPVTALTTVLNNLL